MAREQASTLLDPIRRLIGEGGCALTDAELLEKFVATADATSFEVLVWRHGAMVLGLCRRVLRDLHEAEDAFQATFLVFARKASSIGQRESIGCWLYKVAYRIALRLRVSATKRPTTGEAAAELPAPESTEDADWLDVRPVLDEEIARLPEKYRAPFVLCYLEGRTNEEAAVQLGCPKGTILSRLARGREWLRSRLTRRGVALTAASLTVILSRTAVSAAVPTALTRSIVNTAIPFAAGKAATELVSATVAALTNGVLRTMILTKMKIAATALLSLTLMGTGITWAARGDGPGVPSPATGDTVAVAPMPMPIAAPITEAVETEPADQPERGRGNETPTTNGKVVSIAKDGKSFTIEASGARGEEPGKLEIKITEKTAITYSGVAESGAKLTEGYRAQIHLENGSKDVATAVNFSGAETGRHGPDLSGKVVEATPNAKFISLENGGRTERGGEPKKNAIPIDNKTLFVFTNVAAGEAKITNGYTALVWLADDGKTAAKVNLIGTAGETGRRDEKHPEVSGKVVAVNANGKTLTVELSAGRDGEATKQEIKFGDKTPIIYNNVGLDGAKLAEGYRAQVWFAEGSKDTAAKVVLTGMVADRWTTLTGKVMEISAIDKDGMTITIENPAGGRGGELKRTKIKIPAAAKVAFFGVGPDEAKPTVGFDVQIRLLEGSTDTATQVMFSKSVPRPERGGGRDR